MDKKSVDSDQLAIKWFYQLTLSFCPRPIIFENSLDPEHWSWSGSKSFDSDNITKFFFVKSWIWKKNKKTDNN